jgi:hypothetical protein
MLSMQQTPLRTVATGLGRVTVEMRETLWRDTISFAWLTECV